MPGEFFDQTGALIPATGGTLPFDFSEFLARQGQQLKQNVGPLFSGTDQGNAALAGLLGNVGQAIAPEGSWQQKLGKVGTNLAATRGAQQQTKGALGTLPQTTEAAAAAARQAPVAPVGETLKTTGDIAGTVSGMAGAAPRLGAQPGASQSANLSRTVTAPVGRVPEALQAVTPGAAPAAPAAPVGQQPQAPTANFQEAPTSLPSLEGQVPSAIGKGAGAQGLDSNLLTFALGNPEEFRKNYAAISAARQGEAAATHNLAQAANQMQPLQVSGATRLLGPQLISGQMQLEQEVKKGQVLDDLASNDRARIEARSREYDSLPLNPSLQRKFGMQTWGQLMRANPQMVQAYSSMLSYDAHMAQVAESAKTRLDQHNWQLFSNTLRYAGSFSDKLTPEEFSELQKADPARAQAFMQANNLKGTNPIMTAEEVHQYEMANKTLDALANKLGLPPGFERRVRMQNVLGSTAESKEAFAHRMRLKEGEKRQAELRAQSDFLQKYGNLIPNVPSYEGFGGLYLGDFPERRGEDAIRLLLERHPELGQEYQKMLDAARAKNPTR